MEAQKVQVGLVSAYWSALRDVEFVGEELACDDDSDPNSTRGTVLTLYRAADGRLLVYRKSWSHWQGENDGYTLFEVAPADLAPNGEYWQLGQQVPEFARPLTLDEALAEN